MAEAHVATAFTFRISNEGVHWNFNFEAIREVLRASYRNWKKQIYRIKNRVHCGVYPARPGSWFNMVMVVFVASLLGLDLSFGLITSLERFTENSFGIKSAENHRLASLIFSMLLWLSGVLFQRFLYRCVLSYMGWMYETRKQKSWKTKIWATLIHVFSGGKPQLYSYQGFLPILPIPSIHDTIQRYLLSIEPLKSEEQFNRLKRLSEEFEKTVSFRLQLFLILKSWVTSNYISDWWERYVYLAGRSPIVVNSNYYVMDALKTRWTKLQAARAASMAHAMLRYMHNEEQESMSPLILQDMVPLCSAQHERQFNTTRIPGRERDHLVHRSGSHHVVVMHRGRFFKCYFHFDGRLLEPCELEILFQGVLDDKTEPLPGEEHLAVLTAGNRSDWAAARFQHFSNGINAASLAAIENAAFVIAFDDEDYGYDPEQPAVLSKFAQAMLHGKGYDRWFDKSFTFIVSRNGFIGCNAEHTWADAPIMGRMWETCLVEDAIGYDTKMQNLPDHVFGTIRYTPEGHCRGQPRMDFPGPIKLHWNLSNSCQSAIQKSLTEVESLINDVDLVVCVHTAFGKGFIKSCGVSPDAFLQLALQLAYYRDAGKFCLTYEASMTRLFLEGRTETVRSCTAQSSAFVRAINDEKSTKAECIALLRVATDYHQELYRKAMTGEGIDRHLFCLYVMSKYLNIESEFLKEVLSQPWKLSTSQTPQGQTDQFDHKRQPLFMCAGGGFGPVADDGYGVSYIISGEDCIFFHVSSKHSSTNTSSQRFADNICKALADIKELFSK